MGQEIASKSFSEGDFATFMQQLRRETSDLESMFQQDVFCRGPHVGGFELEAWLVGDKAQPMPRNAAFLTELANPEVVPELSQFNFEINVEPKVLTGRALGSFSDSLSQNWRRCREVANKLDLDVMSIGIHPLLRDDQLVLKHMSQGRRYRALNEQILKIRNKLPITLDIQGREHLHTEHFDVMLEAATTSFQIHLQVQQEQAAKAYNVAQLISAPLVAISANSPYLFGADLWDESRIPLFEQAVDMGNAGKQRVTLGNAYVRDSLVECFTENLHGYPVLIPARFAESDKTLPCLRLHNGTIWRWNRPLLGFDQHGQPHLRIENRVVPAGPTIADMIANAAFFWGLVETLIRHPKSPQDLLPFATAKNNFYSAMCHSLDSTLDWFDGRSYGCGDLIRNALLPMAKDGLDSLGIAKCDANHYLSIIEGRVENHQNGAIWQRSWVAKHGRDMQQLSLVYLENQHTGTPVHQWDI